MKTLHADIEEKKARIEKIKVDMKSANYDERVAERVGKARTMEDRRDELNSEIRSLSLQADSRARFDIKRSELKSKQGDIRNTYAHGNLYRHDQYGLSFVSADSRQQLSDFAGSWGRIHGLKPWNRIWIVFLCGSFDHLLIRTLQCFHVDSREKEQELSELDGEATDANGQYQRAVSTISDLNTQVKTKREELKSLWFAI